jgi:OOP family OmpA-OmpF porin
LFKFVLMKKRFIICCCFLLVNKIIYSQYISDPSFEDTLSCPSFGTLSLIQWYKPSGGTTDNFCSCFTPNDFFTTSPYQFKDAKEDDCFVGMALYSGSSNNSREYLETKLLTNLDSNKKYCVRLYTIRSPNSNFALSNISIGFRADSAYQNTGGIIDVDTFYRFTNQIIKDTVNWTKLTIEFKANGSEQYLSIGNFDQEEDLNIFDENSFPTLMTSAYYFFDMITLEECPPKPVEHFLVYPNPSSGGSVYMSNYADTVATVTLYNSLGQRVAERMLPAGANGLVAFEGLASGVYIAVYQTATGYREEKKVVVLR